MNKVTKEIEIAANKFEAERYGAISYVRKKERNKTVDSPAEQISHLKKPSAIRRFSGYSSLVPIRQSSRSGGPMINKAHKGMLFESFTSSNQTPSLNFHTDTTTTSNFTAQ